jgi:hypothetical protein
VIVVVGGQEERKKVWLVKPGFWWGGKRVRVDFFSVPAWLEYFSAPSHNDTCIDVKRMQVQVLLLLLLLLTISHAAAGSLGW